MVVEAAEIVVKVEVEVEVEVVDVEVVIAGVEVGVMEAVELEVATMTALKELWVAVVFVPGITVARLMEVEVEVTGLMELELLIFHAEIGM